MSHESSQDGGATTDQAVTVEADQVETTQTEGETDIGISENVAGALAYFWGFVTGGILYFVESKNEFVRFHAAQSIVLSVGLFAFFIGFFVFQFVIGFVLGDVMVIGLLISIGFTLLWFGLAFVTFLLYLYMMYSAFTGEKKRLPVAASVAEKHLL